MCHVQSVPFKCSLYCQPGITADRAGFPWPLLLWIYIRFCGLKQHIYCTALFEQVQLWWSFVETVALPRRQQWCSEQMVLPCCYMITSQASRVPASPRISNRFQLDSITGLCVSLSCRLTPTQGLVCVAASEPAVIASSHRNQ